jgi:hypothetical protein
MDIHMHTLKECERVREYLEAIFDERVFYLSKRE